MKVLLKLILLLALVAVLDDALVRPHRQWSEAQRQNAAPDSQFAAIVERLAQEEPTTRPTPEPSDCPCDDWIAPDPDSP